MRDAKTNGADTQETAALRRDSTDLSLAATLDALANARRRAVVRRLAAVEQTTITNLAGYIAAEEHDCAREDLSHKQRKALYVALYQSHLDKLAVAGIIDYDDRDGTVAATEGTTTALGILEMAAATTGEDPQLIADDEQPAMRVRCTESDCDHDEIHTADTRHMAITKATVDSATHEHRTEREFVTDHEDAHVTIIGPDAIDRLEGQR